MAELTPDQYLKLANDHLKRAEDAPEDENNVFVWSFWGLENAVKAAATHAKIPFVKQHWAAGKAAKKLAKDHGLADVSDLLSELNDGRKSAAYGTQKSPTWKRVLSSKNLGPTLETLSNSSKLSGSEPNCLAPNTAKPLDQIVRRWPTAEAKQWVQEFAAKVCADTRILTVVAFGSAVRSGEYCADIDLLVIHDRSKPRILGRPIEVDIRWHERFVAERLIAEGHELLGWVLRYGELICERAGYWTSLRQKWLHRMPFPSAEIADQRAKRAADVHTELLKMGDSDAAHEQFLVMLTQQARSLLIREGIYPASRPELPMQLRQINENKLSQLLGETLKQRGQP